MPPPVPLIVLVVAAVSTGVLQVVGVITAALVAAAGTYLVAKRSTSGSIKTSDAATLWRAAERIREEQSTEIVRLRDRVAVLEAALRAESEAREALEREVRLLRGAIDD